MNQTITTLSWMLTLMSALSLASLASLVSLARSKERDIRRRVLEALDVERICAGENRDTRVAMMAETQRAYFDMKPDVDQIALFLRENYQKEISMGYHGGRKLGDIVCGYLGVERNVAKRLEGAMQQRDTPVNEHTTYEEWLKARQTIVGYADVPAAATDAGQRRVVVVPAERGETPEQAAAYQRELREQEAADYGPNPFTHEVFGDLKAQQTTVGYAEPAPAPPSPYKLDPADMTPFSPPDASGVSAAYIKAAR